MTSMLRRLAMWLLKATGGEPETSESLEVEASAGKRVNYESMQQ